MSAQKGEKDHGNNSSSIKPPPVKHNGTVVDIFFQIIQNKASAASKDGTYKDAWGSKNVDYATEHRIVQEHIRPFLWGIGSAVITFAGFRISNSSAFRPGGRFHGLFGWSSSSSSSVGNNKKQHLLRNNNTMYTSKQHTKDEMIDKALSLPIDLMLSFLIGGSATLFLIQKDKMMRDMASLPLVRGRSLVSETLCKDFIVEHNKMSNDFWDRDHSADFPSLDAIHAFVLNCKKRNSYEKMLRKSRGISAGNPVVVPRPGVPPNFNCDEEDDEEEGTEDEIMDDALTTDSFST